MKLLNKKENYFYLVIATLINLILIIELAVFSPIFLPELSIFLILLLFNALFFYSIIKNLDWGSYLGFTIYLMGFVNTILIYYYVLSLWLLLMALLNLLGMVICVKEISESRDIEEKYRSYKKYNFLKKNNLIDENIGEKQDYENNVESSVEPYHEELHELPQFKEDEGAKYLDFLEYKARQEKSKDAKNGANDDEEFYESDEDEFIEIDKDFFDMIEEKKKEENKGYVKSGINKHINKNSKIENSKIVQKKEAKMSKGRQKGKNVDSDLVELEQELEELQKHKGEKIEFSKKSRR